ncbi:hypothetical protein BJV82DRAFT_415144 [Fennellomyces sp. T-0311]|nr:hypothetical protein BJV82DRAFT_415144 [Fennellomyces sp. T-0311]
MSVNELLTLAKEVASIIDAREGPVLPLLKRVLGKAESIEKLLNLSSTEIDMLEQCGVDLWNNALHLNLVPSAVTDETIATLREIGYRMIRPATESVPATFESVLQQFEMACFRGKAWTDCEQYDRASAAFDDAERCNAQFDSLEFTTKRSVTMNIRQATCILQFYMFKAELHVRQGNWEVAREQFSKAVDYCVSNLPLIDDKNNIRIEFLCRLGIAISQDLINQNKFIDSLELIGCVFSKFDYQAHDEQFMLLLMQTIAHAILYVTTTLESSLQTTLIEIIQNAIAMFPNLRDNKEYHLAKLGALTKGELLKAKSDNVMLEIAMENFPIDQAKTPACYLVTTARLMINCLSMDVICEGLDLVLQRRRGTVQENAFSMGSLYLIKLYILSDAVNHSNHSIELCLTKTINDLYMDRQDITPTDLNACQMVSYKKSLCIKPRYIFRLYGIAATHCFMRRKTLKMR